MKFFRNVLGTFFTEVFIVVLNLLIGVLTARMLGPYRRGVLALVMTLPLTLVYFADLGISKANVYLIGRHRRPERSVAANSAVLALIVGVLIGLIVWLARSLVLNTVLRGLPARYLALILLLTPLLLLHTYWMAILRAGRRFGLFNLLRLLMPVALLGFTALALLIFKRGIGWTVVAYVVSVLLAVSIGLVVVGRLVRFKPSFDYFLACESLVYGVKSYVQNLLGHLTYRLDIYLVAFFLTLPEIAFYGIAISISEMVCYIPNSVGLVLFPKLSATEECSVHQVTAEVCRHTLLVTALASVAVLVAGVIGIPLLYGVAYTPVVLPLLLLIPGTTMITLYKVLARNFSSRNRQEVSILVAGAGLALNGVLDWFLIPRLGIVGAALGSSCAYIVMGVAMLFAFRLESRLSWREILWPQRADLTRYQVLGQHILSALQQGRRLTPVPDGVGDP